MSESDLIETAPRRTFLKTCLSVGVLTTLPTAAFAGIHSEPRFKIHFINTHTGEKFQGVYRIGQKYLPDAFQKINYVLRDFRTGDVHAIDPRVIDIIASLHLRANGGNEAFEIISGYRSPKTNNNLRNASTGVAKNSYHMKGRAIDLRLPSYSTKKLHEIACNMKAGGAGYYGGSNFIHVDTGHVRSW